MSKDLLIRLAVVFIALLQPIIIVTFLGWNFKSFSKMWETELQFYFIIANASVSYYMFKLPKWEIPAMLLLLLTAFNTTDWSELHNVLAGLFFISVIYPLYSNRLFLFLYLFSVIFATISLLAFETVASWVICSFHLHSLYILYKFKNR
jgi:hypothetical protein